MRFILQLSALLFFAILTGCGVSPDDPRWVIDWRQPPIKHPEDRLIVVKDRTGDRTRIRAAALVPHSTCMAVAGNYGLVGIWDYSTGQEIRRFGDMKSDQISVACSPQGDMIAAEDDDDKAIRVWNISTGKLVREFNDLRQPAQWISFSPDGTLVGAACWDRAVKVFSVYNDVQVTVGHNDNMGVAKFSQDGQYLYHGGVSRVSPFVIASTVYGLGFGAPGSGGGVAAAGGAAAVDTTTSVVGEGSADLSWEEIEEELFAGSAN